MEELANVYLEEVVRICGTFNYVRPRHKIHLTTLDVMYYSFGTLLQFSTTFHSWMDDQNRELTKFQKTC